MSLSTKPERMGISGDGVGEQMSTLSDIKPPKFETKRESRHEMILRL